MEELDNPAMLEAKYDREQADEKERQRELAEAIDGYDSPLDLILHEMVEFNDLSKFAAYCEYPSAQDMIEEFYEYLGDPNDDYWKQLVIDYFA